MYYEDYKWEYSNFGYALIGYAIAMASNNRFSHVMDEFLSKELGLINTYTGAYDNKNLHGFSRRNKDCGNWNWKDNYMSPAGSLSSTADDLLRYAMLNIKKEYMSLCHQKHADLSKKPIWVLDGGYIKTTMIY